MSSSLFVYVLMVSAWLQRSEVLANTQPVRGVECVVDGNGKSVFSVIIPDKNIFLNKAHSKIQFMASANEDPMTGKCDSNDLEMNYVSQTDINDNTGEALHTATLTTQAADAVATRIQFKVEGCSFYEKVGDKHTYKAQLELGFSSWGTSEIVDLRCDFSEQTDSDKLVINPSVPASAALTDQDAKMVAELKINVKGNSGNFDAPAPENSGEFTVKLGQELQLVAKIKGDLNVETAFKSCKICKTDQDCDDQDKQDLLIGEKDGAPVTNCKIDELNGNDRFMVSPSTASTPASKFVFPAFRFSKTTDNKLYLQCTLVVCKKGADSACRKKCGGSRRRRRSAEEIPAETVQTAVALKVVTPPSTRCPSIKTVQGISRLSCTNGTTVGSVCRQDCSPGFAANVKGQKTAMRVCQDHVTDSIGPFYFGTKPAWVPDASGCNDVNECLQNPCPSKSPCVNTFGSYYCKNQNQRNKPK